MNIIEISVYYDFICPWCWIGHGNLKEGIKNSSEKDAFTVRYLPIELNPAMPSQGMNRKAYRSEKFGSWERSTDLDAAVTLAGKQAGLTFNYEKIAFVPNTRLAHRLMQYVQSYEDDKVSGVLFEAIFSAYFEDALDIGNESVLAKLAGKNGLHPDKVQDYLVTTGGMEEVLRLERESSNQGIHTVPLVRIGTTQITGAQPPYVFVQALDEFKNTKFA